jgi:hypothetical protein
MRLRWLLLLITSLLAASVACGGEPSAEVGSEDDDYTASDYPADQVLPYAGGWLVAPKTLAGVGQFDRLRGTIYDDSKCSTMVAIGAAIVGGEDYFVRFVDAVARKRDGKRDDLEVLERVRAAVAEKRLTPRHLHELTDVTVRAYDLRGGAYDEQIAEMVKASGYRSVRVGSSKPQVLVDALQENDVVPLSIMAPEGNRLIPHITLLWKDRRGVVRLYDSDDVGGSHVMPRGSRAYNDRMTRPDSAWDLAEKYRQP